MYASWLLFAVGVLCDAEHVQRSEWLAVGPFRRGVQCGAGCSGDMPAGAGQRRPCLQVSVLTFLARLREHAR